MSRNNRRTSLSPSERQRTKSRSPSRSHQTEGLRRAKTSLQISKQNTPDGNSTKRSKSSKTNRSPNATSAKWKKSRSNTKTPTSLSASRRGGSRGKKSALGRTETDSKELCQPNDSERQDLSTHGLSIVPTEIFELVTLRRLILSNNNLSGLTSSIRSLVNLEYLDISRNPLRVKNGINDYSCIPREFIYLRNLQTLIMAECSLKYIPIAVWNTVSLQILDISRNKVGYIVSEIGNLSDIRHLRLSQMDLDTLPPEIGFCEKLQTIDLTGNPIDNLPETLVECRQLYEFKINYRTFYRLLDNYMLDLIDEGKIRSEHIPQVIYELEGLHVLDLNQTKLNSIPNEHVLSSLTELYLAHNFFTDIPESISTMNQLKILDMSYNRLQNIPEHFVKIKRLETLILSNNNLTTVPSNLARLVTLTKLVVSHNQINTIEKGFSQCPSLLTLDLSYNKLNVVPEEICHLERLTTLDLRYNQLESLPLSIRQMKSLRIMNKFGERFQRIGLHLLGNSITDPPSYLWKSTSVQPLFDYIETKEKRLSNNFHYLKLIFIGSKNTGKTTLTIKLINNSKMICNTRKTLDMYVSILQKQQTKLNEQHTQQKTSDQASSVLTDQWIENRISTTDDHFLSHTSKIKRLCPLPLTTYRSNELFENFINKSTLITHNNLHCTIFDLTSEPSFEILYPLVYDSNALFILPVNLTILFNIIQAATSLETFNENDNNISMIDYDVLLTNDWLYLHIFRFIESISDHCEHASIAVIGLIKNGSTRSNDQQQQLLDEIHSKVNMFLTDEENQRKNITLYSDFFPEPIYLDDNEISDIIEKLETIGQQWNIVHHKQKCQVLKRRLGLMEQDALVIDYKTCLKRFQKRTGSASTSTDNDSEKQEQQEEEEEEKNELVENEISQMTFDQCLDYLKITGDILYFRQGSETTILIKPYYILNNILSRTIFRPHIEQWLNYDENMIFHYSGYYPTEELFDIDRQRLLTRGEYTWKMLNILFNEQNQNSQSLAEQNIINYCHLMECLYLGYLNESNSNYREFTTPFFVCPWLMTEKSLDIDYIDYFKSLERKRIYENLECERTRKIKQQQLWIATDIKLAHIPNEKLLQASAQNSLEDQFQITIEDLPTLDQIKVSDAQIINHDSIQTLKITDENFNFLPDGFYERLLICLHSLFYERLDYSNTTIGRTMEKNLIKIERSETQNEVYITTNNCMLEQIQNILIQNLFSFYPTINLRIET